MSTVPVASPEPDNVNQHWYAAYDQASMPADLLNLLVLVASVAAAFFISRWIASRWRNRRREQEEKSARAGESRQVRRARERRGK